MPDGPPVVEGRRCRATATHIDLELAAHRAQVRRQRERHACRSPENTVPPHCMAIGIRSCVTSSFSTTHTVPESPGWVASEAFPASADEEVGDVLQPADRLVSIEQRGDPSLESPLARRARDRAADQVQRQVVDAQIGERPDLADAVDRGVPQALVLERDQTDVEVDAMCFPGATRTRSRIRCGELLTGGVPDPDLLAAGDGGHSSPASPVTCRLVIAYSVCPSVTRHPSDAK